MRPWAGGRAFGIPGAQRRGSTMSVAVARPDPDDLDWNEHSVFIELGPLKLRGTVGIIGALLLGLVIGLGALSYAVFERRQPAPLVEWLAREEAIKRSWIIRSPVSVSVNDAETGTLLAPQNKTYIVKPGQRLRVESKPEPGPFDWTIGV